MKIIKDSKTLDIKVYNTFLKRLKGFMFKKSINYGICLNKCNSIHTFFMRRPIDVIMTDKNYNILYIYKFLKPYRIILPKKKVYYTFELPANYFKFNINEKIKVK